MLLFLSTVSVFRKNYWWLRRLNKGPHAPLREKRWANHSFLQERAGQREWGDLLSLSGACFLLHPGTEAQSHFQTQLPLPGGQVSALRPGGCSRGTHFRVVQGGWHVRAGGGLAEGEGALLSLCPPTSNRKEVPGTHKTTGRMTRRKWQLAYTI